MELIGWRVEIGGATLLHVGDAIPDADDLAALRAGGAPDLLLAPWWALTGERGAALVVDAGTHGLGLHVGRGDGPRAIRTLGRGVSGSDALVEPGEVRPVAGRSP